MNTETKNQIHQIIDELIKLSEWVKEWIIKNKEVNLWFSWNIKKVYSILENDSFEYKKFDNWKTTNYHTIWTLSREEEKYAKWDKSIQDLIWILKEITGYNHIENEKHFKIGENYQITRYLWKLFQNAKNEIFIVDGYIDSNLFDYIEEIEKSINIKVLTSWNYKTNFKNLYLTYSDWNLETRISNTNIHDRYIILDQKIIYLVWASLNWIWKSDFSIKQLNDISKINDLYDIWNNSLYLN
ncbi:MAG: hypothetical protein ACD_49C00038G0043 [uncultured bacterium (gcode 4)]|uniref:Uncharacterized protein n=1 Tax=uncultured bacterium (gcode 4) TaxID=1234023 RepID=K2BW71_9BACT|nr:MAG: hypothetical protein ACD_49C00038G0043 [uncultured bacterium (gcode 4)]